MLFCATLVAGDDYSVSEDEEHAQLPPLRPSHLHGGRRRHPDFDNQDSASYHRTDKENRRVRRDSDEMANTRGSSKKAASKKKQRRQEEEDEAEDPKQEVEKTTVEIPEGMTTVEYISHLHALALRKAPAKSRNSGELTREEKQWIGDVKCAVREHGWGSVKFINDDRKLARTTEKIFEHMKPKGYEHLTGKALREAKAQWVVDNKEHVRTAFIELRNYAQSQLRDVILKRLHDGEKIPTPEEVVMCALRDPKMAEDGNHWIFDLYWDDLLFRVAGKEYWDDNIRHYQLISTAKKGPGKDAKHRISSGTEAFLVTLYKNFYNRWRYMGECKGNNTVLDRKHKDYQVEFVDSNKGQARWGGWNEKGRAYFQEIREKIDEARAQENAQKLEQECLDRLRIKHEIVVDGKEQKKKGKKRKATALEEEVIDDGDEL